MKRCPRCQQPLVEAEGRFVCMLCGYGTDLVAAPPRGRKGKRHQAAGHRPVDTSIEAGRGVSAATAARQRDQIRYALHEHGPRLTRDAISALTGIKVNTVTWRIKEMMAAQEIVELNSRARTRSGAWAHELQLASEPVPVMQRGLL